MSYIFLQSAGQVSRVLQSCCRQNGCRARAFSTTPTLLFASALLGWPRAQLFACSAAKESRGEQQYLPRAEPP